MIPARETRVEKLTKNILIEYFLQMNYLLVRNTQIEMHLF